MTWKAPLQCPHGCGYTLELDFNLNHQHIRCHECLCEFCAVCVGLVTIKQEEDALLQGADKAHLN